jgi:Immunity protein 50
MGIETEIQNSHLLTDIFGRFPSFHDAEVLRITLERGSVQSFSPYLQATIHVFEMTSQIDERGRYVLKNHAAVTFRFAEIYELSLEDFNQQNVLQGLYIVDASDRQLERIKFEVALEGIHGVTAKFLCNSISVESVAPFVPEPR